MKAEHRHELKTNDLAEWLANLPKWAKENLRIIIYASVIVILVAAAYFWKNYEKNVVGAREKFRFTALLNQVSLDKFNTLQSQKAGQDLSFNLIKIAEALNEKGETEKIDLAAAMALIKSAEAIRTEMHYRKIVALTTEEKTAQINKAKAAYNQAIVKAKSNPTLTAAAKFGLGLCEEELGNFDQAKKIYTDLTTDASLQPTVGFKLAEFRLQIMDEYKEPVVFKPAPKEETLTPSIQINPPQPQQQVMKLVPVDSNNIDPNFPREITLTPAEPVKIESPGPNKPESEKATEK